MWPLVTSLIALALCFAPRPWRLGHELIRWCPCLCRSSNSSPAKRTCFPSYTNYWRATASSPTQLISWKFSNFSIQRLWMANYCKCAAVVTYLNASYFTWVLRLRRTSGCASNHYSKNWCRRSQSLRCKYPHDSWWCMCHVLCHLEGSTCWQMAL